MEPIILYKSGGSYRGPHGTSYQCCGAKTEEELERLVEHGWFVSKEEALFGKTKPTEPPKENSLVKFEDLTVENKKEIMEYYVAEKDEKAVRKKFNLHHYTLKKLIEEYNGLD